MRSVKKPLAAEKEAKTAPQDEAEMALIGRRTFLKGFGLAATATAVGGTGTLLSASAASAEAVHSTGPGELTNAPVVMVWRQVQELDPCRSLVDQTLRLPELDRSASAVFYDGGSLIVGYEAYSAAAAKDAITHPRPAFLTETYRRQPNPTNTLVHVPLDFAASQERLNRFASGAGATEKAAQGETLHFMDDDGNQSSFYQPSRQALAQPAGRKVRDILERCAPAAAHRPGVDTPVVALELLVSDLPRSTKFYSETLGLRVLSSQRNQTSFDLGTIVLTLRPEPTGMLVDFLNRSGRMLGAWTVFHVQDIDKSVQRLSAKGVAFPSAIESLPVGRVAHFGDPDGHSWVLWQPSENVRTVAYHPALSRIVGDSGTERVA